MRPPRAAEPRDGEDGLHSSKGNRLPNHTWASGFASLGLSFPSVKWE